MLFLTALILAVALGIAVKKLWDYRQSIHRLSQSVAERQPFLRENQPAHLGAGWDRLCTGTSELIAELNRLNQLRSGQLMQLEATLGSLQEAVLIVDQSNHI